VKIGVVGPTEDVGGCRAALLMLLRDQAVDQVVFLGTDGVLDGAVEGLGEALAEAREALFLDEAVQAAEHGTPDAIRALLDADDRFASVGAIRKIPAPPARAVELVGDRIVLWIHDKALLDEDDIANASLIVHARSEEAEVRRFGKRAFATPGPLAAGHLLVIEPGAEGLIVSLVGLDGRVELREALGGTQGKLTVA
jgi:hypothetical protein